ncbi:glycosyltransferase [Desulfobotulus sp. H1]|uniref:Glycosyltransferase n=1 Tax=Desulfobotulus pelophilus TaxID=2823377 RepID=A0ABT3NCX8_9BACT|nr:glycosyltransferase [Desulfobotulus pelophilus]
MVFHCCHLTSVHSRHDTRIVWKQCRSLVKKKYAVTLIVGDGKGDECSSDGMRILDVGLPETRGERFFHTAWKVYKKALLLDADLYHLHDPELIVWGILLKMHGKKVVFDVHEDIPVQILSKPYIPKALRGGLSFTARIFLGLVSRGFDAIVTATPFIQARLHSVNACVVNVNNFPMEEETKEFLNEKTESEQYLVYAGSISPLRGMREMVEALALVRQPLRLKVAGIFPESDYKDELRQLPGWQYVDELGWLDRTAVCSLIRNAMAGLVILHPIPNYIDSLPVKMFEYMGLGIPVIASDFPLWRSILKNNHCGLFVDPVNSSALAEAIDSLSSNPALAEQMGKNGYSAVMRQYTWKTEEQKLLDLYENMLGTKMHMDHQ